MYPYDNKYMDSDCQEELTTHRNLLGLSLETDYIPLASNNIKDLEFEGQKINAVLNKFANTLILEINYDYKLFSINKSISITYEFYHTEKAGYP